MDRVFGPITQVFRGYTYPQIKQVVEVLLDSPVTNIEVALNTSNALQLIRKLSVEFGSEINVGAGTVLSLENLKLAHDVGATFVLSPIQMTKEMLQYCMDNKILSIPGAFTPTEIAQQFALGADIVKVFPANTISYTYANKICEPLGKVPLMAVGGVTTKNIAEVILGGYSYVGTAGGIFTKSDIISQNKEGLMRSIHEFTAAFNKVAHLVA